MKLARLLRSVKPGRDAPLRLYLHVGMNKTGTTAIQHALARNDDRLRSHGLLYPRTGRGHGKAHYLVSHSLGHSHSVPPLARDPREIENLGPRIRDEARQAGCQEVLISSEAFMIGSDLARVREFCAEWDCRIVIYLRRHDHWWASGYSQGVRTVAPPPWESGFEHYLELQRRRGWKGDYRRIVKLWSDAFGESRIIVRPYEREQNTPNIVADLLAAIGRPELAEVIESDPQLHNESLGEREIQIIDAIQRAGLENSLRKRLVDGIRSRPGQTRGGGFIAPALRRELVEQNLEDYAHIARTYMGRPDGILFREPLPDPAQPWTPPAPASLREIIEAVAAAAASD